MLPTIFHTTERLFLPSINLNVEHISIRRCMTAYRLRIHLIWLRHDLTIRWHINRTWWLSVSVGGVLWGGFLGFCVPRCVYLYDT